MITCIRICMSTVSEKYYDTTSEEVKVR